MLCGCVYAPIERDWTRMSWVMTFNFDEIIDRSGTDSAKWGWYDDDVLPMFVADMDFRSPSAVIEAIKARAEHGVFGYTFGPKRLKEVIVERMQTLYQWTISPDHILFMPGLVGGLNLVASAIGNDGDGVIMNTPIYGPFLSVPKNHKRFVYQQEMVYSWDGQHIRYEIDFDGFEAAITDQISLLFQCNPQNPTGVVYTRAELERLAEICLRKDVVICSDEIHCDLLLDGQKHIPIATLSPEVEARTITMMAASKTFNLAGLACGFAIVPNDDLRQKLQARAWTIGHGGVLGYTATQAAYEHGQDWLEALLAYLTANRDFAVEYIRTHMPQIRTTCPDGTYLLWMDCREAGIDGVPAKFFEEKARVGLNDGAWFGNGGAGFVRLNMGCPRSMLEDGLQRMRQALESQGVLEGQSTTGA